MTANPTPLPPEGVTLENRLRELIAKAETQYTDHSDWMDDTAGYSAADQELKNWRTYLPALLARIAATSAAEGEAKGREDEIANLNGLLTTLSEKYDAVEARATKAEAANARLMEALANLLPTKLCGESWNLPDNESITIVTTFGNTYAGLFGSDESTVAATFAQPQPVEPASTILPDLPPQKK